MGSPLKQFGKIFKKTLGKLPPKMIVVALIIVSITFNKDHPNYVSKIRLTSSKRKRFIDILTRIFINFLEKSQIVYVELGQVLSSTQLYQVHHAFIT
jgi:hypothetical protein